MTALIPGSSSTLRTTWAATDVRTGHAAHHDDLAATINSLSHAADIDINASFTVYPNSTTDSSAGINAALVALGAGPGIARLTVPGFYTCSNTIQIGNGTASAVSTQNGIYLMAAATPLAGITGETAVPTSTVELRTAVGFNGAAALVQVNGPIFGGGMSGIRLRCSPAAAVSFGTHLIAARGMQFDNIEIFDFAVAGHYTTSRQNLSLGMSLNTMKNRYNGLYVRLPRNSFSKGVFWDGNGVDSNTNTWGELYDHLFIEFPQDNTTVSTFGLYQGDCDSQLIRHIRFQYAGNSLHGSSGAGANVPIVFDFTGTGVGTRPTDNVFDMVDFGNTSLSIVYAGSPTVAAKNVISQINLGNLQPSNPALARLEWQAALLGTANTHTVTVGAVNTVFTNTSFDGGSGFAYTIGDIVAALKTYGILKASS